MAPFAVAMALLSALLTFVVLTGLTPIEPTRDVVYSFLLINAATILLLVAIIIREVWQVVQARRRGRAAARLHVQIVGLFSVIAVLPAVVVAIVADVTIDRGFDRLFSGPTRAVIHNSLTIARAYLSTSTPNSSVATSSAWPTIFPTPGRCSTRTARPFGAADEDAASRNCRARC